MYLKLNISAPALYNLVKIRTVNKIFDIFRRRPAYRFCFDTNLRAIKGQQLDLAKSINL